MSASTGSDGYEEERLAGMARAQEHYGAVRAQAELLATNGELGVLTATRQRECEEANAKAQRLTAALEEIHSIAKQGITPGSTRSHIVEVAEAALEIPAVGTRVRCLLPHRGEFGEVVAWDRDLGRPLVHWDSDEGGATEAVEPHEFTTDLNEVD